MKNIHEILAGLGITIPEEKKTDFDKELAANYKTVPDYEKQVHKLEQAQESLETAQNGLKAFEGVDVGDLKAQITRLTNDLAAKDTQHAAELDEHDFSALLDGEIIKRHGRDTKAIRAMLDLDTLRKSTEREKDVGTALEELSKQSGWLFESETPPPYAVGTGTAAPAGQDDALRAAFGLSGNH